MDASTTSQPISAEASSGHSHGMLPQIHVINLDRSADRFATFNCRNSHLASVLRFPAVDGALVDREELMRNGVISEDCPYSSGALGCALSHVALWKKAANEELTLTIFEDDVVCSLHFAEETARLLSTLPEDWDLINGELTSINAFLGSISDFQKRSFTFTIAAMGTTSSLSNARAFLLPQSGLHIRSETSPILYHRKERTSCWTIVCP